jgi:hypothetical protein
VQYSHRVWGTHENRLMCLHENNSEIHIGTHLSNIFPTQNGLKQDALSPMLLNAL